MRHTRRSARRRWALSCVVVMALVVAPLPVLAENAPATPAGSGLQASIRHVAATTTPIAPVRAEARMMQGSNNVRSTSFLKSPVGIFTLVVFGAGVSYAIYSSQHDRITSPGR